MVIKKRRMSNVEQGMSNSEGKRLERGMLRQLLLHDDTCSLVKWLAGITAYGVVVLRHSKFLVRYSIFSF